jgi:hypothetical protein
MPLPHRLEPPAAAAVSIPEQGSFAGPPGLASSPWFACSRPPPGPRILDKCRNLHGYAVWHHMLPLLPITAAAVIGLLVLG